MQLSELREHIATASFHPVEGGAVVYEPRSKRLFALNPTAGCVWLGLADGASEEALAADLVSLADVSPADAGAWVQQAFTSFAELLAKSGSEPELADPVTHAPIFAPGTEYLLLGQTLRVDPDPAAEPLIQSLLGDLRAPDSVAASPAFWLEVRNRGERFHLRLNGEPVAEVPPRHLAAEVDKLIFERLLPRAPHFLAFHAAALKFADQMVIFPAPAGSGKTTLSAALARRGWTYNSDEMAILDRSLEWRGVPLPPCVKSENYRLIESWYPRFVEAPEHERHGRQVRYLRIPVDQTAGRVKIVVFPSFEAAAPTTTMARLDPFTGLRRLLEACVFVPLGFEAPDVSRLLAWHEGATYFTLTFSDADGATATLAEKLRETLAGAQLSC